MYLRILNAAAYSKDLTIVTMQFSLLILESKLENLTFYKFTCVMVEKLNLHLLSVTKKVSALKCYFNPEAQELKHL